MCALPELASTKLPAGTAAAISRACSNYGVSPSQYLRAALHQRLVLDGLSTAALDVIAPRLPLPAKATA